MPRPLDDAPANGALNLTNLPLVERYGGKYLKHAVAAAATAHMAWPVIKHGWNKYRRRDEFIITVGGLDEVYPDLHEWVLAQMPEKERKAMIASTHSPPLTVEDELKSGVDGPPPQVRLRYDGSRRQKVQIDGHKAEVWVEQDKAPDRANFPEEWRLMAEKIAITTRTVEGRNAVVAMINGLLRQKHEKVALPTLWMPSRYGPTWNRRGDLPPRTTESVILKEGQLEHLLEDLGTFLSEEEDYVKLSMPWHRGYLFHGSPGTGKTSVARALANHFDLQTYYLPLGDLEKDVDLLQLVSAIEPRSVLLMEDVDSFGSAKDREDKKGKASIAAALNSLDGVWTPHGLVTILTTNKRESLEDALLRPGRIDVDEEFTPLDVDQARRLAKFFGQVNCEPEQFDGQAPAAMIEDLRRGRISSRV